MRHSSGGLLAIDIALSLSYCPATGVTYALLFGSSDLQAAFIQQQVIQLAPLASHPALLPTLICSYLGGLLRRSTDKGINDLLEVETESGQTGVGVYDMLGMYRIRPLGQCCDHAETSKRALGIIQMATAWECHAKQILSHIESVRQCVTYINSISPHS